MRNYKLEKNLIGKDNWANISFVSVSGIPDQASVANAPEGKEREEVIQSWNNIAVMKATSEKPTSFYIGFFNHQTSQYLKHKFTTDLQFGMRIGPEDMNFMVIPLDLTDTVTLTLVTQTTEDDPTYDNLILL